MIMQIILYPGPRVTLLNRAMPLRKIRKEHKTLIKHQYPIFFFNQTMLLIS